MKDRLDGSVCAVIDQERIVLGLITRDALDPDRQTPVERIMRLGPSTFRPSMPLSELSDYMTRQEAEHALITDPDGRLIGYLSRAEVERAGKVAEVAVRRNGY